MTKPYYQDERVRPMTRREFFFARILAALGLGPRHEHTWRTVGYGGAAWYLLRCDTCGAKEIA